MPNPIWMYDENTGEGMLFPDDTKIPSGYLDSPALCKCTPIEAEVIPNERDLLKAEAESFGLEFASNIKTEKLKLMIEEAKK